MRHTRGGGETSSVEDGAALGALAPPGVGSAAGGGVSFIAQGARR